MRIPLNNIMEVLKEKGADAERIERARQSLPALVETREHEQTLQDLGLDVEELTSADHVPGPRPDDINPEEEGPVGAPDKAHGGERG